MVIASFNGVHNSTKSRCFLVLYHRAFKLGIESGLGVRELSEQAGVSYLTVKSKVGKWTEWKYLLRHVGMTDSRPVFVYSLSMRGKHFVENRIPPDKLQEYVASIRESKRAVS